MNRRRVALWSGGSFVIIMLGSWFLAQSPDELEAWVREKPEAPPQHVPVPAPPPIPRRESGQPCLV